MAAEERNEESEPLSPEQRLDILEKKVGSNKMVLLVLALFLIIAISVSVTVFVVGALGGDTDAGVESQKFVALETDVNTLKENLLAAEARVAQLKAKLDLQEIKLANSGNKVIQSTMIDQEKNYQTFLGVLRSAVYDLANMVTGSRAWLELYTEQIDEATAYSNARIEKLKNIETSEEKVDSFFGDF